MSINLQNQIAVPGELDVNQYGFDNTREINDLVERSSCNNFLAEQPSITYWRWRYPRHTPYFMRPEKIIPATDVIDKDWRTVVFPLRTKADLVFRIYAEFKVPGIHAVSSSSRRAKDRIRVSKPEAIKRADRRAYRSVGKRYCDGSTNEDGLTDIGYAEQHLKLYGEAKNYGDSECEDVNVLATDPSCLNGGRPWVRYVNALGQFLVNRAVWNVGDFNGSSTWADYLYMYGELTGNAGKPLRETIGKYEDEETLIQASRRNQTFYVPLCWYISSSSGYSFMKFLTDPARVPLSVTIRMPLIDKCVVKSEESIKVVVSSTGEKLTTEDIVPSLDVTYTYLSEAEKESLVRIPDHVDQIMTDVVAKVITTTKNSTVSIPITAPGPMIEILVAVRRAVHERNNNPFNYSGIGGNEPIESMSVCVRGRPLLPARSGIYWRQIVPANTHSRVPDSYVYCISFTLDAESDSPNGEYSPPENEIVTVNIDLQRGLENEEVSILAFTRYYSIMRYKNMTAIPVHHTNKVQVVI